MPVARLALVGLLLAQSGWQADPRVVRETAAKRGAFNFDESKVPAYTQPDLLAGGGKTVRTALNQPRIVGRRGYHVRRGGHNLTRYDWQAFMDFSDALMKRR